MAHKFVSSNSETKYDSAASCSAITALCWNLNYVLNSWAISLTSLWKGSFRMRRSVDFWYFLISLRATVPGLNLCGFLTPVVTGAVFLAIFCAISCFLGTFWAVDFLAVCFVLAILNEVEWSWRNEIIIKLEETFWFIVRELGIFSPLKVMRLLAQWPRHFCYAAYKIVNIEKISKKIYRKKYKTRNFGIILG